MLSSVHTGRLRAGKVLFPFKIGRQSTAHIASRKVKLGLADRLPQPNPAKQCVSDSTEQQAEQ